MRAVRSSSPATAPAAIEPVLIQRGPGIRTLTVVPLALYVSAERPADSVTKSFSLDSHQLCTGGRPALDGHRALHAVKVAGYQANQFLVCLTLDSRSSDLSHPAAIR